MILFVVESKGKIATIQKYIGSQYIVSASNGIFRDLEDKQMSVNMDTFDPIYIIKTPSTVTQLKGLMKKCNELYIATDLDREGEGIALSLLEVLKPKSYKRLLFGDTTKTAIMNSIKNAGSINYNAANSQKARRVLDRLFGYSISPCLISQFGGNQSGGRVQSPTLRLVVEKEKEIDLFWKTNKSSYYRIKGVLSQYNVQLEKNNVINLERDEAVDILNKCINSVFTIIDVKMNKSIRNPPPPFTTSTLQQAAHAIGINIDHCMKIAQKLYEGGHITYMRTDSIMLSEDGMKMLGNTVKEEFGKEYHKRRVYENKKKNTQEAHEAIRPTDSDNKIVFEEGQKLYNLIRNRALASQMASAEIEVYTIIIEASKVKKYVFISELEKVIFPGFLILGKYNDYNGKIRKIGSILKLEEMHAKEEFKSAPSRYTQASLVSKMEKIDIGRPATYVNSVGKLFDKKYIETKDVPGKPVNVIDYSIIDKEVVENKRVHNLGSDKKKIVPTSLGIQIIDYLLDKFAPFIDYSFTADMETKLDLVASGKLDWHDLIKEFWLKFQPVVEKYNIKRKSDRFRELDDIYSVGLTNYGPVVKKLDGSIVGYANLEKDIDLSTITLKDAKKLEYYPRVLGINKRKEVYLKRGPYGLYVECAGKKCNVENDIDLTKAVELLENSKTDYITFKHGKSDVKIYPDGKFGPYMTIVSGKTRKNYKLNGDVSKYKCWKDVSKFVTKTKK